MTDKMIESRFASLCSRILESELRGHSRYICLEIARVQEAGQSVKHEDLASLLAVSKNTVRRAISSLKEEGVIQCERKGQHEWTYRFPAIEESCLPMTGYPEKSCLPTDGHPEREPHTEPQQKHEVTNEHPENPAYPRHVYNYNNVIYLEEYRVLKIPRAHAQEGETMEKALQDLEGLTKSILEKSTLKISPSAQSSMEWPTSVPKPKNNGAVERMRNKSPNEYNCNDLMLIFKTAWAEKGWKGMRVQWSKVDLAIMKRLIDGYGAVEIIETIYWMFTNWEKIRVKYRLNCSYPTVQVMSGFSASWVPEALNGEATETRGVAEFDKVKAKSETEVAEDRLREQGLGHLVDAPKSDEYYLAITKAKREIRYGNG